MMLLEYRVTGYWYVTLRYPCLQVLQSTIDSVADAAVIVALLTSLKRKALTWYMHYWTVVLAGPAKVHVQVDT